MAQRSADRVIRNEEPTHRSGWTLLESLISLTIFSGLMAVLLSSLNANRQAHLTSDAYLQVQQEARRALDTIMRELREAGHVNNDVGIAAPGVQRLDFQLARSYDAVGCGGVCWGTDEAGLPTGWIHYVVDPAGGRLVRCVTAGRLDAMPVGYAGCGVLAADVETALATTGFTYDATTRTVTTWLRTALTAAQIPTGRMQLAPEALVVRIPLRNTT
jgi:type II secretory pathway pseudopilin PulG